MPATPNTTAARTRTLGQAIVVYPSPCAVERRGRSGRRRASPPRPLSNGLLCTPPSLKSLLVLRPMPRSHRDRIARAWASWCHCRLLVVIFRYVIVDGCAFISYRGVGHGRVNTGLRFGVRIGGVATSGSWPARGGGSRRRIEAAARGGDWERACSLAAMPGQEVTFTRVPPGSARASRRREESGRGTSEEDQEHQENQAENRAGYPAHVAGQRASPCRGRHA